MEISGYPGGRVRVEGYAKILLKNVNFKVDNLNDKTLLYPQDRGTIFFWKSPMRKYLKQGIIVKNS